MATKPKPDQRTHYIMAIAFGLLVYLFAALSVIQYSPIWIILLILAWIGQLYAFWNMRD
jgi:hypothetical protein